MKAFISIIAIICLTLPANASIFGEENAALYQILAQAIQQLAQLRAILANGKDTLGLLQDINKGINDSLVLYQTYFPNANPGIYSDWGKVQDGFQKLQAIYGMIPASPDSVVQENSDREVAEAVTLNNSIYDYTKQIDDIGEEIKIYSHQVSPGGAQKLTAQTLGIMLEVQNEQLRAQATALKLQAQTIAVQNKKDKDLTRQVLNVSDSLSLAMQNDKINFDLPRF